MLANITVSADPLLNLADRHMRLILVLRQFADRNGKCFPSLRTIADRAKRSLAWVGKQLREMESLGYFERERNVGSYCYRLAKQFLSPPRMDSSKRPAVAPRSQTYQQEPESTGSAQKESKDIFDSKSVTGTFRRFAARKGSTPEGKAKARDRWIAKLGRFAAARGFVGEFWTRCMGDAAAAASYLETVNARMRGEGWDDRRSDFADKEARRQASVEGVNATYR
jgi:DNA-binding transcriptional regulator YhcF (GntR family)